MKKLIAFSLLLTGLFISSQVSAQTEGKTSQTRETTQKKDVAKTGQADMKKSEDARTVPAVKSDSKAPAATQTTKSSTTNSGTREATQSKEGYMTKTGSGNTKTTYIKSQPTTQPVSEPGPATKTDTRTGTAKESSVSTGKQGNEVKEGKVPALETNPPVQSKEPAAATGKKGEEVKTVKMPAPEAAPSPKTQEIKQDSPSGTKMSVTKDAAGKSTTVAPQEPKKDVVIDKKDPEKK